MSEQDPLREGVAALARLLINDASLRDTLQRVTDPAAQAIPAVEMTGLSLLVDDRQTTAFFSRCSYGRRNARTASSARSRELVERHSRPGDSIPLRVGGAAG